MDQNTTREEWFLQPDIDKHSKCSKIVTKKRSKHSHESGAGELNIHSYSHGSGKLAALSVASTRAGSAHQPEDSSDGEQQAEPVQQCILEELQRVNIRLDAVEGQMSSTTVQHSPKRHSFKLSSTSGYHKKCSAKPSHMSSSGSDSSSEESDIPDLSSLRCSRAIQKKVDKRLTQLEQQSCIPGNCNVNSKIKSNRGGNVEVVVEK